MAHLQVGGCHGQVRLEIGVVGEHRLEKLENFTAHSLTPSSSSIEAAHCFSYRNSFVLLYSAWVGQEIVIWPILPTAR